jgi:hypothetical protein
MAGILHSSAYLRDSRWSDSQRPADYLYAVRQVKPLTANQLAISLAIATGQGDALLVRYEREKDKRKLDRVTLGTVRPLFESDREYPLFAERMRTDGESFEANTSQALFLTYHPVLRGYLKDTSDTLVSRLKSSNDEDAARQAVLRVLARTATDEEVRDLADFLAADKTAREKSCQELLWALFASAEFRFNY